MTELILAINGMDAPELALALAYILCGILGVLIYRFIAGGPANPFGEYIERKMFYTVLLFGPLGLFMALVTLIYLPVMAWKSRTPTLRVPNLSRLSQDDDSDILARYRSLQ